MDTQEAIDHIVGTKLADARQFLTDHEFIFRICYQDGRYFTLTRDCNITRFNLTINGGTVTAAYVG